MEDKNVKPSESDQHWLKELFDQASAEPQPEDTLLGDIQMDDEQWLQELFASTQQAAEREVSGETEAPSAQQDAGAIPAESDADVFLGENFMEEISIDSAEDDTQEQLPTDPDIVAFLETILPQEEAEEAESIPEAPLEAEETEFWEEEDENSDDEEDSAPSKRRPKNKQKYGMFGLPHVVVTAVWLVIILMIGGFLGQWIWKGASDVLAFGREEKVVTITITENDDLDSLIDKLHSAGLINEPMWFRWYAQITDVMEDIGTGTFELNTLYDYRALVSHMSPNSAARVTVKVVIPEGYTCAQIFQLLEEKGVCSASDLETASMGGDFSDYWFLEGVTQTNKYCLEGYLFPDTYEFYVGEDANHVLSTLLNNFDNRFTDIMMSKLDVLNDTLAQKMRENGLSEEYIQEHQYTIREVVIIASMIEKETSGVSEGYTISSLIYNRLTNPEAYPCLELKRPLIYITGRGDLTEEDFALDSPYNTFLNPGLIPGPICNPGRTSLDAALDPAATNYYYFAYNPATSSHHFFATEAEYLAFLETLEQEEPEE